MNLRNKIALITGASGGIGAAIARMLAGKGATTVLTGRNRGKLDKIREEIVSADGKACIYPADLLNEKERIDLVERIAADLGRIDVFINNAGFGWYGYTYDMEWETCRDMLRLNVEAMTHMTLMVMKKMQTRATGHIVHVGSISGFMPIQGISVYSSTKAFVKNFSESLYREMRHSGINVSCVVPSAVRTEFFSSALEKPNGRPVPAGNYGMEPEKVARRVLSLLNRPRKLSVVPRIYSILPAIDMIFGWVMDLLGPVLLRKNYVKAV